jgi:hypothetical protein
MVDNLTLPSLETREDPRAKMENPMRFSVTEIKDGPWLVLDLALGRKIVASCFDPRAAETFAALMNGDLQSVMAQREAAIASLGRQADPSLFRPC